MAAVRAAGRGLRDSEAPMVASSVTFFALLALVPAVIAFVSVYGLVTTPEEARAQLQGLGAVLPARVHEVVMSQARSVTQTNMTNLWGAIASTTLALLGASNGTAQLMRAVSIAYDQPDERSFVRRRGLAVLLTVGFVAGAGVALATIAVLPGTARWAGLDRTARAMVQYGRWPVLAVMMTGGLSVLYAVAPHRRPPRWRWLTWGSAVATALWLSVSVGFAFFLEHVGLLAEVYGTLAGAVVLLLWLFMSALVIMVGAQLNAQLERQATLQAHG